MKTSGPFCVLNAEIPKNTTLLFTLLPDFHQCYDSPEKRSLGDPKWHKPRIISFPLLLQVAIKKLWAANGKHEFVF
jgi:hypothetical protein